MKFCNSANLVMRVPETKIAIFLLQFLLLMPLLSGCSHNEAPAIEHHKHAHDALMQDSIGASFVYAQKALEGYEKEGDSIGINNVRLLITMLYNIAGQHENARVSLDCIRPDLLLKNKLPFNVQNYLRLKGYYEAYNGKFAEALAYNDSLLAFDSLHKDSIALALDKLNKIEILIRHRRLSWAKELIDSIPPILYSNPEVSPIYHTRKAELCFFDNELDSAKRHAEMSIEQNIPEASDIDARIMSRQLLTGIDSIRGDLQGYAHNRNLLDDYRFKVRGKNVENSIEILQAMDSVERLKLENRSKHITTLLVISLLVIVVLLAAWIVRSLITRQKIIKLTCDALDVEVFRYKLKNNLLVEKVKILNNEIVSTQDEKNRLQTIIEKASFMSHDMAYIDILKKRLNDEYGDFQKRMRTRFPNLSKMEELLAGFIRMELTTAEMLKALNIEPRSLIQARYRLRKKLDIENIDDLNNFIRQI